MNEVYEHYDYLKLLASRRFPDAFMADEAYTYAFEKLAEDDWRRIRAFNGGSSFRTYIGVVWSRLLEDYSVRTFGRITTPRWIQQLGVIWEELFRLLCCRNLTSRDAIEKVIVERRFSKNIDELEAIAAEIVSRIPECGKKKGVAASLDDGDNGLADESLLEDARPVPEEETISREKMIALQALANVFLNHHEDQEELSGSKKYVSLIMEIRKRVQLNDEERFMLITHFVDGKPVTMIGRCLGLNSNQISGKFRRLIQKINDSIAGLLVPYIN